jgi:hypothetical protein
MRKLLLSLAAMTCFVGSVSAADHITVLNGTMHKIDDEGNQWRQQGALWVEVRRDGAWKNTQRISASTSDNLLIVLQNNWLHSVDPSNGAYTVLTRGVLYDPKKMTGLCGLNGYAYFIYDDTLCRVKLDGTGGMEPINPTNRWPNTEAMASNQKSMLIVQNGVLHRLYENGSYTILTPGTVWSGTTSIFPASEGNYVITQRGWLHLLYDVDKGGAFKIVKP